MYHCGGAFHNGGGYAYVRTRGIWKISISFIRCCCENFSALKIKLLLTVFPHSSFYCE